ncbi:AcrR family transcriptional regulator [Bacillus pakistanensis]|uniref:AcrR family transcriptional regulator n=1 Tax=Rossellomorea pakistanensis TaxID=992288 RepID=A0ABS2NE35_9BACI|nr:TetR family transcriptional regulator [Bacillus pakistanensis]MBM7586089.1 AcrR family transcriptional regulator [Bacillus pakistanensis]
MSKHDKIIDAAMEVISEKGFEKTSISEIVKRAGIAQGTFYLYFKTKSSLIPAIASRLLSITLERIKSKDTEGESFWYFLDNLIEETFTITEEHKEVITLCYSGLAIEHSMEKWEAIYEPYYHWMESTIEKAISKGEIQEQININLTAQFIINMIENTAERYYMTSEHEDSVGMHKKEIFTFIKRSLCNA